MVHDFFQVTETDRAFYDAHIRQRLPRRILDSHVHLALPEHTHHIDPALFESDWALQCGHYMTRQQMDVYATALFPDQAFDFVALPEPIKGVDIQANNAYLADISRRRLMATLPEWTDEYCERTLLEGGFAGFKPYPNLVSTTKGAEMPIFDFMTHAQLKLLDQYNKAVLIHLPRAGRLPDDDNIRELKEIRQKYPRVRIVIAHFGRCFNIEHFMEGIKKLGSDLGGFYFDTAAVINPKVYTAALEAIAPDRILFGTDMPILLWHGRRTWNNGTYQNLCREDFKWNAHTEGPEAESGYTFFIYEQLRAVLDVVGDDEDAKRKIFYENAARVYEAG